MKRKHDDNECSSVNLIQPNGKSVLKEKDTYHTSRLTSFKNIGMHDRNPYRINPPDFRRLGVLYPDVLGCHMIGINKDRIDFTDPDAMRSLTKTLMMHDFSVQIEIPSDRLCPPVPNRCNYICWISELLDNLSGSDAINGSSSSDIVHHIVDIGVGASAIFPLLGAAMFTSWMFTGTDIDSRNIEFANTNIDNNPHLRKRINVLEVEDSYNLQETIRNDIQNALCQPDMNWSILKYTNSDNKLFGPLRQYWNTRKPEIEECNARCNHESQLNRLISACMTNPPFYDINESIQANGSTICTGSTGEMKTVGGEVSFLLALVVDSLVLRYQCVWYTCMVGKKRTISVLLKALQTILVKNGDSTDFLTVRIQRFTQGRTMRWGVAWSYYGFPGESAKDREQNISTLLEFYRNIPRKVNECHLTEKERNWKDSWLNLVATATKQEILGVAASSVTSPDIFIKTVLKDRIVSSIADLHNDHTSDRNRVDSRPTERCPISWNYSVNFPTIESNQSSIVSNSLRSEIVIHFYQLTDNSDYEIENEFLDIETLTIDRNIESMATFNLALEITVWDEHQTTDQVAVPITIADGLCIENDKMLLYHLSANEEIEDHCLESIIIKLRYGYRYGVDGGGD